MGLLKSPQKNTFLLVWQSDREKRVVLRVILIHLQGHQHWAQIYIENPFFLSSSANSLEESGQIQYIVSIFLGGGYSIWLLHSFLLVSCYCILLAPSHCLIEYKRKSPLPELGELVRSVKIECSGNTVWSAFL